MERTVKRDWNRLSNAVIHRRTSQEWTQQEVWDGGGPSDTLQSDIEQGRWRPTRSVKQTLDKIDTGLQWQPGSAAKVLAGGDPTPLDQVDPSDGSATRAASPPSPTSELNRGVMDDLINTVGRTRDAPAIDRATEIFRVIATSVNITRNTLIHETGAASRDSAINSIYAATNAIPYMRDALNEIKRENDDLETATQSDAQAESRQDQEAGGDDAADEESARPAGDHHPPSSAESSAQSRRGEAADAIHDRFRRSVRAKASDGGKNPPGLSK